MSSIVETARNEWGGYARASVAHYPGSYLVIRPTFKTPGNIYAYVTDIAWDGAEGGLVFQERNRPDARNSQRGRVRIPNPSVHLYLVSGKDGWLRSVTLSFLDDGEEMHGIISTLHNVGGAMYMPVAAPIVYIKRAYFDDDRFGELTPQRRAPRALYRAIEACPIRALRSVDRALRPSAGPGVVLQAAS